MSLTGLEHIDARARLITKVSAPRWAPRFPITRRFIRFIPEHAALPSPCRTAYIPTEHREFGGVYMWADRTSAPADFDESADREVCERGGVDARAGQQNAKPFARSAREEVA